MFSCALLCVLSSFAIVLIGKRELVALLCLSSWCVVTVFFFCGFSSSLQCVIVVFNDHTHFFVCKSYLTSSKRL